MTLLYLIRHGDTYFEPQQRIKGRLDVPLSMQGRKQAESVAAYFTGVRADGVYCSTLRRTQEGARLVACAVGKPVIVTPLLDEAGWGLWQGLSAKQVERERAVTPAIWERYAPLGEHRRSMASRVGAFLNMVAIGRRGQTIIAVTHGGVIRTAVLSAIGLTVFDRTAFTAQTGTISLLKHDGECWSPVFLNCSPERAAAHVMLAATRPRLVAQFPYTRLQKKARWGQGYNRSA